MYTPENTYISEERISINIDHKALKDETRFSIGLKEVMETIVGLLKDRMEVGDSSTSKKNRVKNILGNNIPA